MVFNITDGYPSDIDDVSEIVAIASIIKNIETKDGNVLLKAGIFSTKVQSKNE